MHAQYIGDLGDSENTTEFPMLYGTPFQLLTDLHARDLALPRNLRSPESQFAEPRDMQNLSALCQIFTRVDVHRDS